MNKENSDPNGNDNQAQAQDEFGAEGRHELLTGGKRRSTLNRNHVASVLPISPILDSQRLPATPNRSFKICCFIEENDDFDGITVLQIKKRWCGRVDSNHHGIATASPSSWCVCQFRHDRTEEKRSYCSRTTAQAQACATDECYFLLGAAGAGAGCCGVEDCGAAGCCAGV